MPLQHAIHFIQNMDHEPQLRESLYACQTESTLWNALSQQGLSFSEEDFEQAVTLLHVRCQSHEDALLLMQKAQWFRTILASLTNL